MTKQEAYKYPTFDELRKKLSSIPKERMEEIFNKLKEKKYEGVTIDEYFEALATSNQGETAIAFQKYLFKNRYFETDANGDHVYSYPNGTIGQAITHTTEELFLKFQTEQR